MASNQSKIMGEVTRSVRFISEFTQAKLLEYLTNPEKNYNLSQSQVREIVESIDVSVNSAYNRSMDEIIRVID